MIDNAHEFQKYKRHKLCSLAYMIDFIGNDFLGVMHSLNREVEKLGGQAHESIMAQEDRKRLDGLLEGDVAGLCQQLGLKVSEDRCCVLANKVLEGTLNPDLSCRDAKHDLIELLDSISREMAYTHFAYISEAKSQFFEQNALFGEEFHKRASSEINTEIKAAGNCLAADLNTAAVFHLMRVSEFGLHKLIAHLKQTANFNLPIADRVEFATWGAIIGAIDIELKRLKGTEKSQTREEELQFYSAILSEARAFQYAWRDPVMHARFEEPMEAENIFGHVKRFMQELASRVPLL